MSIQQEILTSRLQELTDQRKLLTEKLKVLKETHGLETRPEEKMRYRKLILETEAERAEVDKELMKTEHQLRRLGAPSNSTTLKPTADAISVFYSYAHEDEDLRDKLNTHLKILERQKVIDSWYDRDIKPGSEWAEQINENLESAQIILLLVSADFIASDYCWGKEMGRAMERHEEGDARVVPIILRECDWTGAPFGKLQALPKNAQAVTSFPNQDQAFSDIARGIRKVAEALRGKN